MKFRLKFRNKAATRRNSGYSLTTTKRHHKKQDVLTVESWNELRKIGSEGKKPLTLENVLDGLEEDVELKEVQDWDYYIAEFNEQYRRQLRQPDEERDKDSISTIAETKSELMLGRHRRMLVYRKCFLLSCFLLWIISAVGAHEWYLTYHIYPIGFLHGMDDSIFTAYFTPVSVGLAFAMNAHSWLVGVLGILCANCFRENPKVLKQFILRVPYMLFIPSILIFVAVRFIGTLSTKKLAAAMNKRIPEYHNFDNETTIMIQNLLDAENNGKRLWDQLQKILECCGVMGAQDWDSVDTDDTDDLSFWPASCCPKQFVRNTWTKERPIRDDCYHKINKQEGTTEYEWAYPTGCLNLAYEFFVKRGAFLVGLMVANFCALCLCLSFGFKYYVMIRKLEEMLFKYSVEQWFIDVFFLRQFRWVKTCFKKSTCCQRLEKPQDPSKRRGNKSFASNTQSQTSADSATAGGGSLRSIPSVIITAPKELPDIEKGDFDYQSLQNMLSEQKLDESKDLPLLAMIDEREEKVPEVKEEVGDDDVKVLFSEEAEDSEVTPPLPVIDETEKKAPVMSEKHASRSDSRPTKVSFGGETKEPKVTVEEKAGADSRPTKVSFGGETKEPKFTPPLPEIDETEKKAPVMSEKQASSSDSRPTKVSFGGETKEPDVTPLWPETEETEKKVPEMTGKKASKSDSRPTKVSFGEAEEIKVTSTGQTQMDESKEKNKQSK